MKPTWVKWSAVPLAVLVSAAGATVVRAQDATPATDAEKKPTIEQRKENQQDRIANGVKSGQLTAGETANLEKKEAAINKETRTDRAANGDTDSSELRGLVGYRSNENRQDAVINKGSIA